MSFALQQVSACEWCKMVEATGKGKTMTAKELLAALQAYYVELYQLGADREAVAVKQFIERLDK